MTTIRDQVKEFHEAFGAPVATRPGVPSPDRIKLRLKLIAEEFGELLEAHGMRPGQVIGDLMHAIDWFTPTVDLEEVADATFDLAYVVEGMNLEYGINSDIGLAEVHRSNMSKLGPDGKPIHREDGKVMKGPNFTPPDITQVLRDSAEG